MRFIKMHFIIYFAIILVQLSYTTKADSQQIADQIKSDGYPSEIHPVTTEDGYIVTVFRIPGYTGSTPVYLMHGLLESGADWIALGKNRSLAYILHDQGYDVWLGNARGNTFSKRHVNLTTNDVEFWNFSFTEVGIYDLPAVINYITGLTSKAQLYYIGHSMGGTFMSIMGIERPDVAKKVKAMIGLAPGTYSHPSSLPLLALSPVWRTVYRVANTMHLYEFLPHGPLSDAYAKYVCGTPIIRGICSMATFILAGYSPEHLDSEVLQKYRTHFPAGTSIKLYVHFLQQMHRETRFNKFNYGKRNNMKIYGSSLPPAYDLSKMRIPTAVFWAENDIIVVPREAQDFYSQLPVKLGLYQVPDKSFNHLDYIIAKDAAQLVYSTILKIMSDYEKNYSNY